VRCNAGGWCSGDGLPVCSRRARRSTRSLVRRTVLQSRFETSSIETADRPRAVRKVHLARSAAAGLEESWQHCIARAPVTIDDTARERDRRLASAVITDRSERAVVLHTRALVLLPNVLRQFHYIVRYYVIALCYNI